MPEESTPEQLTELAHTTMPFSRILGLELVEGTRERVVGRIEWTPERCTSNGVMHGGYLMAAVDSVGAMCAVFNLPEGAAGTSTIESKTNFCGAVRSGAATITAAPVHVGSTTIVVQTDVTDERGRLVTRSLQTQIVLMPRARTAPEASKE